MIVMKFGGTSTQDADAVTNVVQIVKNSLARKPFVVISAIAQATNLLEQAGKLAAHGNRGEARDCLLKLFDRHFAMVDLLIKDKVRHIALRKTITDSLAELEELVKGICILRELTPRTLDALYCYGELLSSRLVAAALNESRVDAEWLDTKDFMLTNDEFTRAIPMMEIVKERLAKISKPLFEQGKIPITQGFIGVTSDGRRTTMGRESSDYSASIIGASLDAEEVQIWTDVDGILTADPRVVKSPRKIKTLSFDEAFELSYFGAKVLHPNTMIPAIEKNIPIRIYNSRRPHLSGTLVTSNANATSTVIKSVAYKRGVVLLTVVPPRHFNQYIFWEHIFSILTKYNVPTSMVTTSVEKISFVLEANETISAIVQELRELGSVDVLNNKGIICVVGSNIHEASDLIHGIFSAIVEIKVSMIGFGGSKSNLSFIIDDERVSECVQRIHGKFFETALNEDNFETIEQDRVQDRG